LNSPNDIADTLSAPLGDLIAAVGRGVAEAQQALDEATLETFKKIYNTKNRSLLAELGYQPTWYKIPEVNAEISISLSISGTESLTASGPGAATQEGQSAIKLYATPIDANYTNKYDYNFQAASTIRFKIVPVPPSPQAANLKVAPDVLGQPYSEVKKLLADLEIPYLLAPGSTEPIGYDPKVIVSDPKAGEILTGGQTIKLSLSAS
jgi:hypothetical protein